MGIGNKMGSGDGEVAEDGGDLARGGRRWTDGG